MTEPGSPLLALNTRDLVEQSGFAGEGQLEEATKRLSGAPVEGRWLNGDGDPMEQAFTIGRIEFTMIESYDGYGEIARQAIPVDLAIPVPINDAAAMLEISVGGTIIARRAVGIVGLFEAKLPDPVRETIGARDGRVVVQIVAERFQEFAPFRRLAVEALEWALGMPPFDDPDIGGELRFDLLFWPSNPSKGLFDTPDAAVQVGRLFHGNRALALELLRPHISSRHETIILINSRLRGGAGGVGAHPAWSSVGGDDWKSVCLHELGHGYGLADEYLDKNFEKEVWNGEPNVSIHARAGSAPWRDMINVDADATPSNGEANQGPGTANVIGTFSGARYRTDYFRPSRTCLMKSTAPTMRFCAVCVAALRRAVEGAR